MDSCMALRRDVQMAQSVTTSKVNCSCDSSPIKLKSQLLARFSVVASRVQQSSSSISAHVHLETVHSRREWRHESAAPQKPQEPVVVILRCSLTSSIGSNCFESLHRNMQTFDGTSIFHKVLHEADSDVVEEPPEPSSQASLLCLVVTSML